MINATNPVTQTAAQGQATSQSQKSGLASDFETFLLMLTTQARNQDPLEPLDSSEYAAQLAQFSMVEQQVQTNELLTGLSAALNGANLDELSGWVGVEVRAPAAFQFDGQPRTVFADPEPDADKAVLVIRDINGDVVTRLDVPTTDRQFVWSGLDITGAPVAEGAYTASLESYKGDDLLSQTPAATYSRVVEAQLDEGGIVLMLDSGASLSADEVTAVRAGA